jgi:hypothetical protein
MKCQVEKKEHFRQLLIYEFSQAPKLQRPPKTFVSSTERTRLVKEQPKNGLRASSKAILT